MLTFPTSCRRIGHYAMAFLLTILCLVPFLGDTIPSAPAHNESRKGYTANTWARPLRLWAFRFG